MLIGSWCQAFDALSRIQDESDHSYEDEKTTDAVAGGTSVCWASGSACSRHTPSRPRILNLYLEPTCASGTYSSQTPLEPSDRIGHPSYGPQPTKSPTTCTPRALGAHTAKPTPVPRGCAPSTRHSFSCRPSPIRCRSSSPRVGR